MIDNPIQITLLDYVKLNSHDVAPSTVTPLDVFWIKLESTARPSEGGATISSGTASALTFVNPILRTPTFVVHC